jgi:hypothetical protein
MKQAAVIFIHSKLRINPKHEIAIACVLDDVVPVAQLLLHPTPYSSKISPQTQHF